MLLIVVALLSFGERSGTLFLSLLRLPLHRRLCGRMVLSFRAMKKVEDHLDHTKGEAGKGSSVAALPSPLSSLHALRFMERGRYVSSK